MQTQPTARRRRSPHDGAETRQALVDAALKLFTDRGVDAVSIRAVNAQADRALAAVHYHFGSKEALIRAVLRWGGEQVERRSVELAREMATDNDPPTGRRIVRILGTAYTELLEREPVRGSQWLTVVEQISETHSEEYFGPTESTLLLVGMLQEAYPHAGSEDVRAWFKVAAQVLLVVLARMPAQRTTTIPDQSTAGLVDFVAGGLDNALAGSPERKATAGQLDID